MSNPYFQFKQFTVWHDQCAIREVVRPKVTELLSPNPADYILDIACGNGNYSSYLAQRGASVVAFDYSKKMIELAKRRQSQYDCFLLGTL